MRTDGLRASPISIVVTTWGTDTYYTQACLESIRRWKGDCHELIVVSHDESPLLRAYLEMCRADGLIDRLVWAASGHGHTRSFNLGVRYSHADVIFNISNDILIGPSLIDDCAWQLRNDPQLGMIGWHWHSDGTFWRDGKIVDFKFAGSEARLLEPNHIAAIEGAPWFTGRYFAGIGGKWWISLCNTAFFGIRRDVLDRAGGGFSSDFHHHWADDLLSYAVLEQGLDVRSFDRKFKECRFFHEFQYENLDVKNRRRHDDAIGYNAAFMDSIQLYGGGMSDAESVLLHLLARSLPEEATIVNLGVSQGVAAFTLLDAMRKKRATFHFIDCFDLPQRQRKSGQPPLTQREFEARIGSFVQAGHKVKVTRANRLDLQRLPLADFVFVDPGQTAESISHEVRLVKKCLAQRGVAVFHDYDNEISPAVKPAVDAAFSPLDIFETLAVYRRKLAPREEYLWNDKSPRSKISSSSQKLSRRNKAGKTRGKK